MGLYDDLDGAISSERSKKLQIASECEASFVLSRSWLHKFRIENSSPIADSLIDGAFCASIEVVSTAYLGLMRPAIFSLRAHYELLYAWIYYKDHPVEWQSFVNGLDQGRLPGAIDKYTATNFPIQDHRWKVLSSKTQRSIPDPYAVLSAFVHGTQRKSVPTAKKPSDIVYPIPVLAQLPSFVSAVSENISDVLVSCFQSNWESLPAEIQSQLDARLERKAKSLLKFD